MEGAVAVTSGVGALELMLAVLPSFGVEVAEVCRSIGVDLEVFRRHGRIAVSVETALWEEVAARLPEIPLGVALAERCFTLGLHESSLYEYLGSFAPTLREAAAAMRARQRLETDAFVTSFLERESLCVMQLELVYGHVPVAQDRLEFSMMRTLKEAQRLCGRPFVPKRVALRRRASTHLHAYGQAFGVPVELGAERDFMVFPVEVLDYPLLRANPVLFADLLQIADDVLAKLAPVELWSVLEAAIERMLPEGELAMSSVASWMGMSPDALQRVVRSRGTTWSEVVDRVRHRMAEALLRDLELPIASVGYRLGFATPASFTRAFRRWTGMTPEAYRRSP